MNRTIIRLNSNADGLRMAELELGMVGKRSGFSAVPVFADDVAADPTKLGAAIYSAMDQNAGIKDALTAAVGTTDGEVYPIYLWFCGPQCGEALAWESIRHPNGTYFSLDRWPVGRIVDNSSLSDTSGIECAFEKPLRLMLILGAANIHGGARREWLAIQSAIQSNPNLSLNVLVLLCEKTLKQEIDAFLGNPSLTLTTKLIENSKTPLLQDLLNFKPHLLHVFCHGSQGKEGENPSIQLASRTDWEANSPNGSLSFAPIELSPQRLRDYNWLVTLNCCEGAAGGAVPFTHSFARTLVESGLPAVVGMRERISVGDAAKFCEAFYTSVFDDILRAAMQFETHGAEAPTEGRVPIEWVKSLAPARRTLFPTADPGNSKQWTLPVLYSRVQPFVMVRIPTSAPAPGAAVASDRGETARSDNSEIEKILATLGVLRDFRNQNMSSLPTAALATLENKINLLESQITQKPLG